MDLECQNAGFLNFECVCYCPEGLNGPNCEHTVSNDRKLIFAPTYAGHVQLLSLLIIFNILRLYPAGQTLVK